jgi:26S proteasome regulatory subunit N2
MYALSAAPLLSQLNDPEVELQQHAVVKLLDLIDSCWHEIASHLPKIEELIEDPRWDKTARESAALLAAKVLFHLGETDEALVYALLAGDSFRIDDASEFSRVLRARCLDKYVEWQQRSSESPETPGGGPSAEDASFQSLEAVVNRIIWSCIKAGEYREALGIALESLRFDALSAVLQAATDNGQISELLGYAITCCQELLARRKQRERILQHLVDWQRQLPTDQLDAMMLCRCLVLLRDAQGIAQILEDQIKQHHESLAYQIAFDVWDHDERVLVAQLRAFITTPDGTANVSQPPESQQARSRLMLSQILSGRTPSELYLDFLRRRSCFDKRLLKSLLHRVVAPLSLVQSAMLFAHGIGFAGTADDTFLRENVDWLARTSNWTKFSATASLGVVHMRNAEQAFALLAPYLSSHQGSSAGSAYSEGGALYALGLIASSGIEASRITEIRRYLLEILRNAGTNEVIQHGACLGLGLCALGDGERDNGNGDNLSENDVFQELRNVLYMDSALSGEAAALSMGMLLLGSGDESAIEQMLDYSRDTQHQKITRGLAVGLALIVFGLEDEAEPLISQMLASEDATIRYGAMFAIGLAYCGSGHHAATKRLLHVAVSDVNDDVRRTAVMNLGFVFARDYQQLPQIVGLLAESYNPQVRYGAALALGVGCACSGNQEAAEIVHKLANDTVDFVRQGALLAQAMLYQHHNKERSNGAAELRKRLNTIAKDKHEETLTKFGAVLGLGIIDAGGRNAEIALHSRLTQSLRPAAVAGMALFLQYWYWYPMVPFLTLAMRPAACMLVNRDMQLVRVRLEVEGGLDRLNQFAYAPMFEDDDNKQERKREKTVLSVTAKADRLRRTHQALQATGDAASAQGTEKKPRSDPESPSRLEQMDIDSTRANKSAVSAGAGGRETEKDAESDNRTNVPNGSPAVETISMLLENPARVLTGHERWISLDKAAATTWRPLRRGAGIVLVEHAPQNETGNTDAPNAIIERMPPLAPPIALANGTQPDETSDEHVNQMYEDEDQEPDPPEPFEYTGNVSSFGQASGEHTQQKREQDDKEEAGSKPPGFGQDDDAQAT